MGKYIKQKKFMILLLVTFIGLGSWYFINNRKVNEVPDKADLVYVQTLFE